MTFLPLWNINALINTLNTIKKAFYKASFWKIIQMRRLIVSMDPMFVIYDNLASFSRYIVEKIEYLLDYIKLNRHEWIGIGLTASKFNALRI